MMKENIIIVSSRKEFIDLFRKLFISDCIKTSTLCLFDISYAINNWDYFWIPDNDVMTIVELKKTQT